MKSGRHRLLVCVAALSVPLGASAQASWRGVDLSYVNEMQDCGAEYRRGSTVEDPYRILADAGANVVRLRLWHSPDWTEYSTLADVRKSIRRAQQAGMQVLLDFHYSDDWAHPGKQLRPAAWRDADSTDELAVRIHEYTRDTLLELREDGLLPNVVAVGNEINTDLLIDLEVAEDEPIDWSRNVVLLNAAIDAVRSVDTSKVSVMLHVAQPENVEGWFDGALEAGVHDFDLIGLSYYPKWSSVPFESVTAFISRFRDEYDTDVVIVETAYPWTLEGNDPASNILGEDSLVEGYAATPDGQRRFLEDLMSKVVNGGGLGIVYWEPAWVSTSCSTRWGQGSHWENATLFDFENRLLEGAAFLRKQ